MTEENNKMNFVPEDVSDNLDENGKNKTNNETPTFDFTEQSWRTGDFILNVEGTKLYVAKNILSLASPVFDRMFQSEFKESGSEELALPGKKLEDVKEFLRCIYPNCLVQVSDENALQLMPLVDEFQVLHLKTRCEHVLVENVNDETPVEELYQRLKEADMYNLNELRVKCIALAIEKPHEELTNARKTCKPPADDLVEIFEKMTAKLTEKLTKYKLEDKDLSEEPEILDDGAEFKDTIKTLEASKESLSNELDILMSYVSAEVKKSKELLFDETSKWKEMHVVLSAPVAENFCSSFQSQIWEIPIRISSSIVQKYDYICNVTFEWLCVNIKCLGDETFTCGLNTRCDLVNMQPRGDNISVSDKGKLRNCSIITIYIKKIQEIKGADAGFIRNGKIGLIVHLYMSEPNRS